MSECWNIYRAVLQKFTISQRFFLHFYVVAFIWTTLLLVGTWAYAYSMVPLVVEPFSYSTITSFLTGGSTIRTDTHKLRQGYVAWQAVFLLLMMEVHVLRRLYETIHVFNYSPSARMHVIGYLTGLLWVFLFIVPQSASLAIAFWSLEIVFIMLNWECKCENVCFLPSANYCNSGWSFPVKFVASC